MLSGRTLTEGAGRQIGADSAGKALENMGSYMIAIATETICAGTVRTHYASPAGTPWP